MNPMATNHGRAGLAQTDQQAGTEIQRNLVARVARADHAQRVQHRAQRVHVGAGGHILAADLLRRGIGGREGAHAGAGDPQLGDRRFGGEFAGPSPRSALANGS